MLTYYSEMGEEQMGYIVENQLLLAAMFKRIASLSIKSFAPATVASVEFPNVASDEAEAETQYGWAKGCPWVTLTLKVGHGSGFPFSPLP